MTKQKIINLLGRRIFRIRTRRHLTRKYVSKVARISKTTLKNLETGRYSSLPSYDVLKRLADALGIQRKRLVYLVTGETGRRVRALRIASHQSQLTLAKNINRSDKAVSHWECGHTIINDSCINSLANVFHVRPQYLLCQSDQKRLASSDSHANRHSIQHRRTVTKPRVINSVFVSLNQAIDKDIPITYHGITLSKDHWNICCRLIKDWCQP